MYESFYGFTEKPFALIPQSAFLFRSEQHERALTLIEYGLANLAELIVFTGEVGAGKTTLVEYLLDCLDRRVRVGFVRQIHPAFGSLMDWIFAVLGLGKAGSPQESLTLLATLLEDESRAGHRVLLVLDEAQNLNEEQLEELRLLSNFNCDRDCMLQVMLVGQPGLRDLLLRPSLLPFAQRVTASFHLHGMSLADTEGYIHHRIAVAGGNDPIFTRGACAEIYRLSRGLPRLINLIADAALVYGYGEGARHISAEMTQTYVAAHLPYLLVPLAQAAGPDPQPVERDWGDPPGDAAQGAELGDAIAFADQASRSADAGCEPEPEPESQPEPAGPTATLTIAPLERIVPIGLARTHRRANRPKSILEAMRRGQDV